MATSELEHTYGAWRRYTFQVRDDDGQPIDLTVSGRTVTAYLVRSYEDVSPVISRALADGLSNGVAYLDLFDTDSAVLEPNDLLFGNLIYVATGGARPQDVGSFVLRVVPNASLP